MVKVFGIVLSSAELIYRVTARYGKCPEDTMRNIIMVVAPTMERLEFVLTTAAVSMEQTPEYALVVVDSFMQPFNTSFSELSEWSKKDAAIKLVVSRLSVIAERFNVAVVLTTHETAAEWVDSSKMSPGQSSYTTPQKRRRDGSCK